MTVTDRSTDQSIKGWLILVRFFGPLLRLGWLVGLVTFSPSSSLRDPYFDIQSTYWLPCPYCPYKTPCLPHLLPSDSPSPSLYRTDRFGQVLSVAGYNQSILPLSIHSSLPGSASSPRVWFPVVGCLHVRSMCRCNGLAWVLDTARR